MVDEQQQAQRLAYVPVGTQYTRDQMAALTRAALADRSIYDPHYAGFEPDFDYTRYVDVAIDDPTLAQEVRRSLEQFSRTERGQHVLRQAAAMQGFRETGIVPPLGEVNHRIPVRDYVLHPETGAKLPPITNQYFIMNNTLTLRRQSIATNEVLGADGNYMEMTLQDVLFHELSHAADGFVTRNNVNQYIQVHGQSMLQTMSAAVQGSKKIRAEINEERLRVAHEEAIAPGIEYPSIRATNEFMQAHYAAPARALRHSASRQDPTGAGVHFYETIQNTNEVAPPLPTGSAPRQPDQTPPLL